MPKVGDLLVVTPRNNKYNKLRHPSLDEYLGIVYSIEFDKWGHQEKVHVQWSSDAPPNYNHHHGYAGTNIHNLRSEFQVIRNGINIPWITQNLRFVEIAEILTAIQSMPTNLNKQQAMLQKIRQKSSECIGVHMERDGI